MSKERVIDEALARAHFETVLANYDQVFENFFLSKFLGLRFEYLNIGDEAAAGEEV